MDLMTGTYRSATTMRRTIYHVAAVLAATALFGASATVEAASKRLPCKQVIAALANGDSLDDVAAAFDTDTAHVARCLQGPKKHARRAKGKPTKSGGTTRSHASTTVR